MDEYSIVKDDDSGPYDMFDLDITPTGVELRRACALALMSNTTSPLDDNQIDCRSLGSGVYVSRTGSKNDATVSCTDDSHETMTYENVTPPSRLSGLPKTVPSPTKIGEGWNVGSFLFGTIDQPSPSASIFGSTPISNGEEKARTASVQKCGEGIDDTLMFECRLKHTLSGKDTVNISMERETLDYARGEYCVQSSPRQEQFQTPPLVNRQLNFDAWATEDVTTVYRDDDSTSLSPVGDVSIKNNSKTNNAMEMDEMELAQVKQCALDIMKRSRSIGASDDMSSSGRNNEIKRGISQNSAFEIEVQDTRNADLTIATADMTNEASMLVM